MRAFILIIPLTLLFLSVIACKDKSETISNEAKEAPAKQDVSELSNGTSGKLPKDFPKDFPLPKEYVTQFKADSKFDEKPYYRLLLTVPDAKEVANFYQESLPKTHYKTSEVESFENSGNYLSIIRFKGRDFKGSVVCSDLSEGESQPTVNITLIDNNL